MIKILLLSTGGTIASSYLEEGKTPILTAQELLNYVPEINELCTIEGKDLMSIDSSNMQPEDWITIAEEVYYNLQNYDAFIITHGTDTMAYTSSILTYMLYNLNKPVIFTGAQKSIVETNTDAVKNILDAVYFARQKLPGVYVVFAGQAILGTRAVKIKSQSFSAFESINFPAAAFINNGNITFNLEKEILEELSEKSSEVPLLKSDICFDVCVLKLISGTNPKIFDFLKNSYKGVIIESFGSGGIPFDKRRSLLPKLEELVDNGIAVVVTTQCLIEGVNLNIYQVGVKAAKKGVIPGNDMTTEALTTKLMWALGQNNDISEIKKTMLTTYFFDTIADKNMFYLNKT